MARILIVGDATTPLEQTRGVVGRRAGHDIFWYSARRSSSPLVTHYGPPPIASRNAIARAALNPFFIRRALRLVAPHIVHVHYAQTGLMAPWLSRFHPLVVTVMGGDIMPDQEYRGLRGRSIKLLLDHADVITSKSAYMDRALGRIGDFAHKTRRITWGVDLQAFHWGRDVAALRRKWAIPEGDLVFFDPRLARRFYNKHVILEAFAGYLRAGGTPATLLVSEATPESDYLACLKIRARELGIAEHVRFVGAIPYGEMPDYYALADLTVSVPPSDGFPQVIYEAMACGSFLIMGNLPQYAEAVQDGVTARLVTVGDVGALVEAMLWASRNPVVRDRARILGRRYVEEQADFDRQATLMNNIYGELLQAPASQSHAAMSSVPGGLR